MLVERFSRCFDRDALHSGRKLCRAVVGARREGRNSSQSQIRNAIVKPQFEAITKMMLGEESWVDND